MKDQLTEQNQFNTFDYRKAISIPEVMLRVELLDSRLKELRVQKSDRVLEVGIGSGDVTLMLADHFQEITCIDPDDETCRLVESRLLEEKARSGHFIRAKIEDASLEAKSFDHIILIGILEHLLDPVVALRLLSKALKPRGRVYICVNLANSLHRILGVEMGDIPHPKDLSPADIRLGHYRVYSLDQLREHVTESGMKIDFEDSFYVKPLPTSLLTPLPMELHRALNSMAKKFPEFASYVYLEATLP